MPDDNFDDFVKRLQQEIMDQEREEYNDYIINLFHDPKNWGKPSDSEITVSQKYTGPCGDTMEFYLKINDGVIQKANFITDGCGASVATGSQTTLLIEGKSIDFALNLSSDIIDESLGGLPEDHKHCAELAARTIKKAIIKFKES